MTLNRSCYLLNIIPRGFKLVDNTRIAKEIQTTAKFAKGSNTSCTLFM